MFDKPEICAECGGACCKCLPGAAHPLDFGLRPDNPPDFTALTAALNSGNWCIDWWEGDARPGKQLLDKTYFVRPAITPYEGELRHLGDNGGICTFLQRNGCSLGSDVRPMTCRMLEPRPKRRASDKPGWRCELHGDTEKRDIAIAWIPYWEFLNKFTKEAS